MRLAFDIEANGLLELTIVKDQPVKEGNRIWCMVAQDIDTGEVYKFLEHEMDEGADLLRQADLIIGHNIIGYDIPMIERLHGPINTESFDTLVVSRLMYPDRMNHPLGGNSLKCWGKALGEEKIEYELGFDSYCNEMLEYCEQDVAVTKEIYFKQQDFANKYQMSVELEHSIATIIATQTNNGMGFDIEAANNLEHDLLMEKVLIEDEMAEIFPVIVEERWSDKTGKRLKDKVTHFNPASRQQIAQRLREKYGWVPPKTEKGNPKVDAAVLKDLPYEEAKTLVQYFDIVKMLSQVSDWILRAASSRDGRIHGSVNSQGTVTGRMTASQPNLQQVSSDPRTRALFVPKEGWKQVGIDASGLEARLLANRMAKWDNGRYAEVVLNGDIHDYNMKQAGLTSRAQTKTFFYGFIYGAGDTKIGKIIGKKTKDGKALKERFLNSMPALKKLIENCQYQVAKKNTITLLDGREVPCRAKHKALNVQVQGDGAILMKIAQCFLSKRIKNTYNNNQVRFMATVHDEWQLECEPHLAEEIGKLGAKCIRDAGKFLKCSVEMDGDYRVGSNWAECH